MPGKTFNEIIEELQKVFKKEKLDLRSSSENVLVEKSALNKEPLKKEHVEGPSEPKANQSCAPQHQTINLDNVKVEKTEPFLHEEKHSTDHSKYRSDSRSLSSDLYRISLYNLIKLEPNTEPQNEGAKTTQDKDCSAVSSALQRKNLGNKRKLGNRKCNTKKAKQVASTKKWQNVHVASAANGTEVQSAKNAACEAAATNKTVYTPAPSAQKNAPVTVTSPEKNDANKSTSEALSVKAQNSIKYEIEAAVSDVPAPENNHETFNSVVSNEAKTVVADAQVDKSVVGPINLNTHADVSMPLTANRETNGSTFGGECKSEKQEDERCASLGYWSYEQRRGRQRGTGSNRGYWQRMSQPGYKSHSHWRGGHNYRKPKGNSHFQGSQWQCQVHGWQNQGNLQKNVGYLMENPGHVWYPGGFGLSNQGNCCHNQGYGWPTQGNGFHNQGNCWPSQGNGLFIQGSSCSSQGGGWFKKGNGWPNQGNGYPIQGNGWYHQWNELQSQGCQNMVNGLHNIETNIHLQAQNNKQISWQKQAYQNQSSNVLNHTVQKNRYSQHKNKILDNKRCGPNLPSKQKVFSKQVKEEVLCLNEVNPQDECKIIDEISGKDGTENATIVQVQHNEAEHKQHINCSKPDAVKNEQNIICIPSEGSPDKEQTASCSMNDSSIAGESDVKVESLENVKEEKCFANGDTSCEGEDCITLSTSQHLDTNSRDDILDKTDSHADFSTGSEKDCNLKEEVEIVWENVKSSNISDSLLIDIK